jgi:cobaltochelatase CobS
MKSSGEKTFRFSARVVLKNNTTGEFKTYPNINAAAKAVSIANIKNLRGAMQAFMQAGYSIAFQSFSAPELAPKVVVAPPSAPTVDDTLKTLKSLIEAPEVVVPKKVAKKHKGQHYKYDDLLSVIKCRLNALLVGPAGSGKTSGAHNVATSLKLSFYSISVGMQTTKSEFFGYMNAEGKYVPTLFRKAFEKGGVFLLDEMDAGNANVITAINQALANEYCAFPDKMVEKHKDFVVVASANTYGTGANRDYVGRNQLDAATLDRFIVIEWGYDEELEATFVKNKEWLEIVRNCRRNALQYSIRTVVSPRAAMAGEKLLAEGLDLQTVKEMVLFKGLNETERIKLVA